jgi:hypothetical protein
METLEDEHPDIKIRHKKTLIQANMDTFKKKVCKK